MLKELGTSNFDIVQKVGQACDYPYNLVSGAHLIAQIGDGSDNAFVNGTRQTIMAGGDSGSRNMFVGAVLGAKCSCVTSILKRSFLTSLHCRCNGTRLHPTGVEAKDDGL